MNQFRHCWLIVFGMFCWTGCGGPSYPTTYPVSGVVTYRGQPVADAILNFSPSDESLPAAAGKTDSSGRYSLTTFQAGDGALPGDYKVRVFKYDTPEGAAPVYSGPAEEENYTPPGEQPSTPAQPKNLLPETYNSISRTPLSFKVSESQENVYDIIIE
jgi:hypothetical protein